MSTDLHSNSQPSRSLVLKELFLFFFRFGATAFGGPAAHIAMMEQELVRKRKWISSDQYLDFLGATNLIPGPNSTEMALHIGQHRAGWQGLLVAGISFVFPAAAITLGCAWFYVHFSALPQTAALFYGIKPVVISIMMQALWSLSKSAVKSKFLAGLGLAAVFFNGMGGGELLVLLCAGTVSLTAYWIETKQGPKTAGSSLAALPGIKVFAVTGGATSAVVAVGLLPLFLFFLKVGSVLYGSGYVLLAFLRGDLVDHWHWLSESQLLDAFAVGQITPGPGFTTATFIGYLLGGVKGATLSTVGIFLPAFFFVSISGPLIPKIRKIPAAGAFLDGVVVASLALMAVVTTLLMKSALIDLPALALTAMSLALLLRYKINSSWLVLFGGVIGLLLKG